MSNLGEFILISFYNTTNPSKPLYKAIGHFSTDDNELIGRWVNRTDLVNHMELNYPNVLTIQSEDPAPQLQHANDLKEQRVEERQRRAALLLADPTKTTVSAISEESIDTRHIPKRIEGSPGLLGRVVTCVLGVVSEGGDSENCKGNERSEW